MKHLTLGVVVSVTIILIWIMIYGGFTGLYNFVDSKPDHTLLVWLVFWPWAAAALSLVCNIVVWVRER